LNPSRRQRKASLKRHPSRPRASWWAAGLRCASARGRWARAVWRGPERPVRRALSREGRRRAGRRSPESRHVMGRGLRQTAATDHRMEDESTVTLEASGKNGCGRTGGLREQVRTAVRRGGATMALGGPLGKSRFAETGCVEDGPWRHAGSSRVSGGRVPRADPRNPGCEAARRGPLDRNGGCVRRSPRLGGSRRVVDFAGGVVSQASTYWEFCPVSRDARERSMVSFVPEGEWGPIHQCPSGACSRRWRGRRWPALTSSGAAGMAVQSGRHASGRGGDSIRTGLPVIGE